MTKRKYIKKITKHLKCSLEKKREIERQLMSDIEIALGEGRSLEQVLSEMGEPEALAAEFNENFDKREKRKAKTRRVLTVLLIVLFVIGIIAGIVYWALPKGIDIDDSKIFDKDEVRARAEEVIVLFSADDYEEFYEHCSDKIRDLMTEDVIEDVKSQIGSDWGEYSSMRNIYMVEIRQAGIRYVLVQVNAAYDNVSVTYTLSFNPDLKLIGFYIR